MAFDDALGGEQPFNPDEVIDSLIRRNDAAIPPGSPVSPEAVVARLSRKLQQDTRDRDARQKAILNPGQFDPAAYGTPASEMPQVDPAAYGTPAPASAAPAPPPAPAAAPSFYQGAMEPYWPGNAAGQPVDLLTGKPTGPAPTAPPAPPAPAPPTQQPLAPGASAPSAPMPASPGFLATTGEALKRGGIEGLQESAEAFQKWHEKKAEEDPSYLGRMLQTPLSQGWKNTDWWGAQIGYGLAKSAPSLALGIGGAAAGGMAAGPPGALVGSMAGFGLGGAMQEIAPAYQRARAEGLSHEEAVDRAWKQTGVAGGFNALMGAVGAGAAANSAKAALSKALKEVFVTMPAIMTGEAAVQKEIEGKRITAEEAAQTALMGGLGGAALVGGHAALRAARGQPAFHYDPNSGLPPPSPPPPHTGPTIDLGRGDYAEGRRPGPDDDGGPPGGPPGGPASTGEREAPQRTTPDAEDFDPGTFRFDNESEEEFKARTAAPQGTGTRADPIDLRTGADVQRAAEAGKEDYSHPQGEANNIARVHAEWQGLPITLETGPNFVRKGVNKDNGVPWEATMGSLYGYFKGSEGADGQHVDVHVGPRLEGNKTVYVLDELDRDTGKFRQHKTFVGFPGIAEAVDAFLGSSGKTRAMLGGMRALSADEFKQWLKDKRETKQPISDAVREEEKRAAAEPTGGQDTAAAQSTRGSDEALAPTTFTTAKGSVYRVHDNGTTTRNKSVHSEHPGDEGPKPRSERTVYLTPQDARRLAPPEGKFAIVDHGDGTASTITPAKGGGWGRSPTQQNVPYQAAPATGLIPLELWGRRTIKGLPGFNKLHFGNEITEVGESPKENAKVETPAPTPASPPKKTGGQPLRPVFTLKTSSGRFGAILQDEGNTPRQRLMVDPAGGYFWGDYAEAIDLNNADKKVVVGAHKDFEPAAFDNSKAARAAAEAVPQDKTEPSSLTAQPKKTAAEIGTAIDNELDNLFGAEEKPQASDADIASALDEELGIGKPKADPEQAHTEVETAITKAGGDPAEVRHADIQRAIEIMVEEGLAAEEAFPLAVVRSLVEDGHLTPEQVKEATDAETSQAILQPGQRVGDVVPAETSGSGAGRPATAPQGGLAAGGAEDGGAGAKAGQGGEVSEGGGGQAAPATTGGPRAPGGNEATPGTAEKPAVKPAEREPGAGGEAAGTVEGGTARPAETAVKRSAEEWLAQPEYQNLKIIDPDGWNRKDFDRSWAEKIDEAEFNRRVAISTIAMQRPKALEPTRAKLLEQMKLAGVSIPGTMEGDIWRAAAIMAQSGAKPLDALEQATVEALLDGDTITPEDVGHAFEKPTATTSGEEVAPAGEGHEAVAGADQQPETGGDTGGAGEGAGAGPQPAAATGGERTPGPVGEQPRPAVTTTGPGGAGERVARPLDQIFINVQVDVSGGDQNLTVRMAADKALALADQRIAGLTRVLECLG